MVDFLIAGHILYSDCLRLCFMKVIQQELDRARIEWNYHRLRPVNSVGPSGHPNKLPQLLGKVII